MDEIVSVIGQHPLGGVEALDIGGILALLRELRADLFADGLNLSRVITRGDDEVVGEGGYFA